MRNFLIAGGTAVSLIVPATAQAKVPLLNLGAICDSLAVVVDHERVSGFSLNGCQTGNFAGVIGKVKGTEGRSMIGSLEMLNPPSPHSQFLLQVSYPFVNGGNWTLYYTKDGYRLRKYQSGTYTVIK